MDKNTHCPENVDEDSWKKLCEVRRKKIQSEEKIQALDNEIYETDQSVCERGALSVQVAKGQVPSDKILARMDSEDAKEIPVQHSVSS